MGPSFLPYAGPVYNRCVEIVRNSLMAFQTWQQNQEMEEPDSSFLVVALDMLSGLVQGLGMALEPYVRSQPNLLELLVWCLKVCLPWCDVTLELRD
jgi:transportin-1